MELILRRNLPEILLPGNLRLKKLLEGNQKYLTSEKGAGDISPRIRLKTAGEGQNPYAIIITCSDSRVIPEAIFQCGIGDLFVIRLAGNVIDNHQLGSIEYAADHLGTKLIMVLGHTHCGAVDAAIQKAISNSSRMRSQRRLAKKRIRIKRPV